MPAPVKPEAASLEAEKLLQALETRGFLTREEAAPLKVDGWQDLAPEAVLERLVRGGLLTAGQAKRFRTELPALSNQPIAGYQLLKKLGQGAMGTVFKARQSSMDRLVAIKILHPKLAANERYLKQFEREAHLAARFSSNNAVQAIDVGKAYDVVRAEYLHYFVMEYVEGVTIKAELEKGKIYEEKEAVEIVLQIAQALNHAHRRGLIHRDIKPANIILTPDGIAKLADLGLSRETADEEAAKAESGMTIGTPYYIAPEQVKSKGDVDSRADLYSLGATLYHMVTGRPPFDHKNAKDVIRAHLKEELTPPDRVNKKLSSGIGEVCAFMMAKNRDDRYPTPEGLILDLESLLRDEQPRIARQKVDARMLRDLADGREERRPRHRGEMVPLWWFYAVGAGLSFSLLLNLILALR